MGKVGRGILSACAKRHNHRGYPCLVSATMVAREGVITLERQASGGIQLEGSEVRHLREVLENYLDSADGNAPNTFSNLTISWATAAVKTIRGD